MAETKNIRERLEKFNADFVHAFECNSPRTEAEMKELSNVIGLLLAEPSGKSA
jgi:translation initiation factor 2 beta subunit (eIF-2beta)/eIF-5